jgi:hypothetical protein
MSFISSIGASIFTDLAVYNGTVTDFSAIDTQAEFDALFATENATAGAATFQRIQNVREYPPVGTPANVVNVPVYGQKTSQQIQGQSDAPSFELQVNYVASDWVNTTGKVGSFVGDGKQHVFRFALLNVEPTGSGATRYASTSAGLGTVENAVFYFLGKIEALLITPALTDASTATLTITIQSAFYGAYTIAAA